VWRPSQFIPNNFPHLFVGFVADLALQVNSVALEFSQNDELIGSGGDGDWS